MQPHHRQPPLALLHFHSARLVELSGGGVGGDGGAASAQARRNSERAPHHNARPRRSPCDTRRPRGAGCHRGHRGHCTGEGRESERDYAKAVLARGGVPRMSRAQTLALYRKSLGLARRVEDPCARHYAWGRVTHLFRCAACAPLRAVHARTLTPGADANSTRRPARGSSTCCTRRARRHGGLPALFGERMSTSVRCSSSPMACEGA